MLRQLSVNLGELGGGDLNCKKDMGDGELVRRPELATRYRQSTVQGEERNLF